MAEFKKEVKVPVLDCGGVFKDYELHKVCALSADIAAMDVLSLNYWLSKFVMEVAKKSGERYPPKSVYGIICSLKRHLEERNGSAALNPLDASDKRYLTTFKSNCSEFYNELFQELCTTIEKREEQDESIALKDVVFQKGNFNNCTINVTVSKKE